MNIVIDNMNIRYPDLGFAFNPIRIFIENYTVNDSIILKSNNITIEREPLNNSMSFELSAIARSLFNRLDFHKIEEQDTTLLKTLDFEITNSDNSFSYTGSIPVIWGALQIGEIYSQNKTLTYFKGFPFTLPLYIEQNIYLQYKADNGILQNIGLLEAGKHNIDITGINANNKIEFRSFTIESYKIADYTFDFTFGPQRVDVCTSLDITVDITDCPNDGIYLRWINKYGEYNYYLFQGSNISSTTKNNAIAFDNVYYATDLTNNYHHGTGKSIGKDIDRNQKLFTPLVNSQTYDMLIGLVESPVIDMFLGYNTDNSQKWISVSVAEGTFTKSTANLQDFELLLIPNKKLIQTL